MQSNGFERGVQMACAREQRYDAAAYFFLRESLDFALTDRKDSQPRALTAGVPRDVPGQRLAQSFVEFAIHNFGPMTSVVLKEWGVERSEDVGAMVYLLIELGIFSRGKEDSEEDFSGQWTVDDFDAENTQQSSKSSAQLQ